MLLVWLSLIWFLTFGIFNQFFVKDKKTYNNNFLKISLFFGIIFALTLYFLYKDIFLLLPVFKLKFLIYIIIFFLFVVVLWLIAKKFGTKPKWSWLRDNNLFSFNLNFRALITRLFDVLFQQIILTGIILFFLKEGLIGILLILVSSLFFTSLHIPVLFFVNDYPIIFLSFIGALIFSFFIINFDNGIIYSILIHWAFYYIIPPLSWLFNKNKK